MKKFVAILTASVMLASSMNMGEVYSMGLSGVNPDVVATSTDATEISTTEETTQATTEATTQATTEATTQATTEQKTTEKTTEKTIEKATEKATESTTEQKTTEAATEQETEEVTELVLDSYIESEDYDSVNETFTSNADRIHYLKLTGDTTQSSDCIIIESNGHYGMIDTSNRFGEVQSGRSIVRSASDMAVIDYLAALGITHLDFIMVTHDHSDHNGGVPRLAELNLKTNSYFKTDITTTVDEFDANGNKISTKTIQGDVEDTSDTYYDLSKLNIIDNTTTYIYKTFVYNSGEEAEGWENKRYYDMAWQAMSDAGAIFLLVDNPSATGLGAIGASFNANGSEPYDDTITFRFQDFNIGLYNIYNNSPTDENANSIVTYVEKSGVKTLLMADIDVKNGIEQTISKAVKAQHGNMDVIKVAHHGYNRSTAKETISTLSPKYAVIQTADAELSSYCPFYGTMKQKGIKMFRTIDQPSAAVVEDLTNGLQFKSANFEDLSNPVLIKTVTKKTVAKEDYVAETDTSGNAANGNNAANATTDSGEVLTKTINTTTVSTVSRTKNIKVNDTYPSEWKISNSSVGWAKWYKTWDEYDWVYVKPDGSHQQGFVRTNGYVYYIEDDAMVAGQEKTIDGKRYYFDKDGKMVMGWNYRNGSWYYYGEDGVAESRWIQSGSDWYFTNSKGKCVTGSYNCNGTTYIFDSSGKMLYGGWTKVDGKWFYANSDGTAYSGWMWSGGYWYYMYGDGMMATGWINSGGVWYYLRGSGEMATGWIYDGSNWYYMEGSGAMMTGWIYDGSNWYYMWGSGAMATGWVYTGGWYYLNGSGAMVAGGWVYSGGKWYYMDGSGAMATGSRNIGGTTYYFDGNGAWYE